MTQPWTFASGPAGDGGGSRTLAESMGAYNPMSYHNGSVWPHDNALCASGLMRYGFVEHAQRVATGVLDAAAHFGHRLPELFCGFSRAEFATPVPYPTWYIDGLLGTGTTLMSAVPRPAEAGS